MERWGALGSQWTPLLFHGDNLGAMDALEVAPLREEVERAGGIKLMSAALRGPKFLREELERERQVVLG